MARSSRLSDAHRSLTLATRALDILLAAVGLVLTAPACAVIGLAIRLHDSGPVFYTGERAGLHGRPFRIRKFRSMVVGADRAGASSVADSDRRLTPIGRWLRRYKLDELPQLWNVLVGDMSFVGPRPQVRSAVEKYTAEERILLTVRPGITDPASLYFSNEAEILDGHPDPDAAYFELIHPKKMRVSIEYVRNRSFLSDVRILVATFAVFFGRRRADRGPGPADISTP